MVHTKKEGTDYTSKFGVVVIFDCETKLPIDFEVESKYCHQCVQSKKKFKTDAEFNEWKETHHQNCEHNFIGPSSEMERASVAKMFKRSLDYGLIYKYLVSDGDSKSYLDVWDTYQLCDHCVTKKDKLDDKSSENFKEWEKTGELQIMVQKPCRCRICLPYCYKN